MLAFAGLILRPVPIPDDLTECEVVTGIVSGVGEGGEHDVLFILEDHETRYYINRGLEDGLNIDELKSKLAGKKVEFYYPNYWTPLDPNNSIRHLSRVDFNNEVVWSEIGEDCR